MKKALLSGLLSLLITTVFAQENNIPPNGWTNQGNIQLLFNQSAFNKEWTGGGTSSISGNLIMNYEENYRKDNFSWTNRIFANYGLTKVRTDEFMRKTSDRFELNSIAGLQMENSNWYYSYFLNFRTQFDKGYNFGQDAEGRVTRTEYTQFFSPAYLQTGPGFMWKKTEDFVINIAPATARFIFVDKKFTTTPGYVDGRYFGVDEGETSRFEFGASLSGYFKFNILEDVTMENNINLYSNYLDSPGNIDIDYLLNLDMGINKYLSANFLFQAIYDDNAVGAFQIREVFGAGINYNF
ncbi:DUF3078 domain-containing protein [Antarcticibacterium flavum]|uniref:DUF3078 domain-containing protein n=1 Tax=Antarcticibacterium flavum TaxID=2058175 RepID=A0A5B7X2M1_9FLAO|nr:MULTISPECIES: DUF3078 domain-containing protein [Antarcticibacterium]MCM4160582.1 hypothetical protein [Antarcticibacterium sp. W02-3]QCY69756.1 DUF3078 domain-containing protein [Antarcticibacterium flavum]